MGNKQQQKAVKSTQKAFGITTPSGPDMTAQILEELMKQPPEIKKAYLTGIEIP